MLYRDVIRADRPIGCWPLDERAGTTVRDIIAGRNGTLVNSPVLVGDSPILGEDFSLYRFPASTASSAESVTMGTDSAFALSGALSVEVWIRSTQTLLYEASSTNAGIIGRWSGGGYMMWTHNGDMKFGDDTSSAVVWAGGGSSIANKGIWYHLAATRSGASGTGRIYLNGVQQASAAMGTATPSGSFQLACYGANTQNLRADLSWAAVYDKELTAQAVYRHYQAGRRMFFGNPRPVRMR